MYDSNYYYYHTWTCILYASLDSYLYNITFIIKNYSNHFRAKQGFSGSFSPLLSLPKNHGEKEDNNSRSHSRFQDREAKKGERLF